MEIVLDDESTYYIKEDQNDEKTVWLHPYFGDDRKVDDRGDLFISLCNVAVNIFPNIGYRNANYIYK